jgi:hypothetical protein
MYETSSMHERVQKSICMMVTEGANKNFDWKLLCGLHFYIVFKCTFFVLYGVMGVSHHIVQYTPYRDGIQFVSRKKGKIDVCTQRIITKYTRTIFNHFKI